jgi:hypothetical protein
VRGWVEWVQRFITDQLSTHKAVKSVVKDAVFVLEHFREHCMAQPALRTALGPGTNVFDLILLGFHDKCRGFLQ